MIKAIIAIVILVIAFPFLMKLIPEPLTYARIEAAYRAAGYRLENSTNESNLGRQEAEGWSFFVDGYRVEVLRYADRGKLAVNLGYLKPDPGTVMVESMNIAQSLGGLTKPTEKSHAKSRGLFVVYVRGPERSKCEAVARVIDDA